MAKDDDQIVTVKLTRSEALVLYDWLYRLDPDEGSPPWVSFDGLEPSEQIALRRIEGQLEDEFRFEIGGFERNTPVDAPAPGYDALVRAARNKVNADMDTK